MSLGIVAGLLVIFGVLVLVMRPLFVARRARSHVAGQESTLPLENLLFEREAVLTAIRDLQMDYAMRKLNDEDFAELDGRYRAQAVQILKQLDELGLSVEGDTEDVLDLWIERAVAEVREGKPRAPSIRETAQPVEF